MCSSVGFSHFPRVGCNCHDEPNVCPLRVVNARMVTNTCNTIIIGETLEDAADECRDQ